MTDELKAETERLRCAVSPQFRDTREGQIFQHFDRLHAEIDRLRAKLEERKSVSFGFGDKVVGYGIHDGRPAVFVSPVKGQPGQVGELVGDKEPFHPHSLLDGEWAMTFPSETQMDAVYEALTGERRTQATDELPNPPSPRTAVPDGWQMVPVEPTAEMLHAAAERRYGWEHGGSAGSYDAIAYYNQSVRPCSDYLEHAFRYEWNAALSAAPPQPEADASGDGREAEPRPSSSELQRVLTEWLEMYREYVTADDMERWTYPPDVEQMLVELEFEPPTTQPEKGGDNHSGEAGR